MKRLISVVVMVLVFGFMVGEVMAGTSQVVQRFYSGSGDGVVGNSSTSWASSHDATSGNDANTTNDYMVIQGNRLNGGTYYIYRANPTFDTSAIPDSATVSLTKISLAFAANYTNSSTGTAKCSVVSSSRASSTALSTADYSRFGSSSLGDIVVDLSSASGTRFSVNLLSPDANINKTGFTSFGLRETDHDLAGIAATNDVFFSFYSSENTNTANRPYLEITYTCDSSVAPSAGGNVISVTDVTPVSPAAAIIGDIIQTVGIADINGNGTPDLLALGSDASGNPIVCKIDGNGTLIGNVSFHSSGWKAKSIEVVPDQNGNGKAEISVLAVNPSTGESEVEMRDSSTNAVVGAVILP